MMPQKQFLVLLLTLLLSVVITHSLLGNKETEQVTEIKQEKVVQDSSIQEEYPWPSPVDTGPSHTAKTALSKVKELENKIKEPLDSSDVLESLESHDPYVRERLRALIQEEQEILKAEAKIQQLLEWRDKKKESISKFAKRFKFSPAERDFIFNRVNQEKLLLMQLTQQYQTSEYKGEIHQKMKDTYNQTNETVEGQLNDEQKYQQYLIWREEEIKKEHPPH